jgi:hypothetical protein
MISTTSVVPKTVKPGAGLKFARGWRAVKFTTLKRWLRPPSASWPCRRSSFGARRNERGGAKASAVWGSDASWALHRHQQAGQQVGRQQTIAMI